MIALQFAAGDGLASNAIKWFGGGPRYSHVDTVMPDGSLLGARLSGGVQIRPANYLGTEKVLQVAIPAGDAQTDAYYRGVTAEIGKPYDMTGILGFLTGRDWRTPDKWFCSELVAAKLESAGFLRRLAAQANKVTPGGLLLVLSALVPINLETA